MPWHVSQHPSHPIRYQAAFSDMPWHVPTSRVKFPVLHSSHHAAFVCSWGGWGRSLHVATLLCHGCAWDSGHGGLGVGDCIGDVDAEYGEEHQTLGGEDYGEDFAYGGDGVYGTATCCQVHASPV